MIMRYSTLYLLTLDSTQSDLDRLVKVIRKTAAKSGYGIRLRGRLGKNNPYRALYAVGGPLWRAQSQDIKLEHAVRIDVYLKNKSSRN